MDLIYAILNELLVNTAVGKEVVRSNNIKPLNKSVQLRYVDKVGSLFNIYFISFTSNYL